MKRFENLKAVLFDLDGTLTDPGEGITNSVAYALRQFGIEVTDRRRLYPFIGPPLSESFAEFYGFEGAQITEAIAAYRTYFRDRGIFENKVYPEIPGLLAALRRRGLQQPAPGHQQVRAAQHLLHPRRGQQSTEPQSHHVHGVVRFLEHLAEHSLPIA